MKLSDALTSCPFWYCIEDYSLLEAVEAFVCCTKLLKILDAVCSQCINLKALWLERVNSFKSDWKTIQIFLNVQKCDEFNIYLVWI